MMSNAMELKLFLTAFKSFSSKNKKKKHTQKSKRFLYQIDMYGMCERDDNDSYLKKLKIHTRKKQQQNKLREIKNNN